MAFAFCIFLFAFFSPFKLIQKKKKNPPLHTQQRFYGHFVYICIYKTDLVQEYTSDTLYFLCLSKPFISLLQFAEYTLSIPFHPHLYHMKFILVQYKMKHKFRWVNIFCCSLSFLYIFFIRVEIVMVFWCWLWHNLRLFLISHEFISNNTPIHHSSVIP